MPYIKKDSLDLMLKYYFMAGATRAYGFVHDESLTEQEEAAFQEYHKEFWKRLKESSR